MQKFASALVCGLVGALVISGCSPVEEPPAPGTGGAKATGGAGGAPSGGGGTAPAATGGSAATGGTISTGGTVSTGGTINTGGTPGGGGAPGSGGAPADGGSSDVPSAIPAGLHSLFDGKTLSGWLPSSKMLGDAPDSWIVQDGALHSTGTVRGCLISEHDYGDFRLIFSIRHLPSTGKDHQPGIVIWGERPLPNDASGGIQIQAPHTNMWNYRPGMDGNLGGMKVGNVAINDKDWAQCEVLSKAALGQFRMACCQRTGPGPCKGVEILKFTRAGFGRKGPICLQVHNKGLHDEYKDIQIEADPAVDDLITTK